MNVEGMMELKNHTLATTTVIIVSGRKTIGVKSDEKYLLSL